MKEEDYPNHFHQRLLEAVLKLKTKDEATRFFRDLLTLKELDEFANRWEMAKLIDKGTSYQKIAQEIGCSTATVSRTAQWLKHGLGGYRLVLDRMK